MNPKVTKNLWGVPGTSLLLTCFLAAASTSLVEGQDGEVRSALDGVYTNEQADRGEKTFSSVCAECHSKEDAPLSGRSFIVTWADRPLYALWEYITTRMPYAEPGSLSPKEYAAVLAYILEMNGYPAGDTPLPHSPFEVANIDLDLPPDLRDRARTPGVWNPRLRPARQVCDIAMDGSSGCWFPVTR